MKVKKLVGIFIFMIISMIYTSNVYAAGTLKISVKCENVEIGNSSKCTITGTVTGTEVSSFHGKINVSGSASFESFTTGSGFNGEGGNGVIDLYTDVNKSGTFSIGTVMVKSTSVGTGIVTISGIEASDSNYENISGVNNATGSFKISDVKVTTTTTKRTTTATKNVVTERATTTTTRYIAPLKLTSVTVDDFPVTLTDEIYYVTVNQDTTEVNINATAGEEITIIGLGKRTLSDGKNAIDLVLKNEFDQTATVQVIITKPDGIKDVETKLEELKVVNYDFTFNPDTLEYSITVPYNVKEIYIIAKSKDENVNIYNSGLQVLSSGTNEITVTSSYGDISETKYKITVKRSYMSLIFLISFIVTGISFIVYIFVSKNKKEIIKDEKIKEKAIEKRSQINPNYDLTINGEKSVGIGKRVVVPTRVVSSHISNEPTLSSNSPAPQIKVIKTINTNNLNNRVISSNMESENHE